MQFRRLSHLPLIPGGNNRVAGGTPYDSYWAKCAQPLHLQVADKVRVYSRGMMDREWAPNTSRTGVSTIAKRDYNPADFTTALTAAPNAPEDNTKVPKHIGYSASNALAGITEVIKGEIRTDLGNTFDRPVYTLTSGRKVLKNDSGDTDIGPAWDSATYGVVARPATQLGEWNDYVIIRCRDTYLMFVSLFYQYSTMSGGVNTYYSDRGLTSVPESRVIVLSCGAASDGGPDDDWKMRGVVTKSTAGEDFANIGPVWFVQGDASDGSQDRLFILFPNGKPGGDQHPFDTHNPALDCGRGVWQISNPAALVNRVTTPSTSNVYVVASFVAGAEFYTPNEDNRRTQFNQWNMIVGRGFKDGTYLYALMPGAHLFTDWPSAVGMWRIPYTKTSGVPTISGSWEAAPLNPIFERGPSEGGTWQLCPFTTPFGFLSEIDEQQYALYQTWSILPADAGNSAYAEEPFGGAWARRLRVNDYAGLDAGRTHKHVGFAVAANLFGTEAWGTWESFVSTFIGKNCRLKNKQWNTYLQFDLTGGDPTVHHRTGYSGNAGVFIERPAAVNGVNFGHVTLRPANISGTSLVNKRLIPQPLAGAASSPAPATTDSHRQPGAGIICTDKPAKFSFERTEDQYPYTTVSGTPTKYPENPEGNAGTNSVFYGMNRWDVDAPEGFEYEWLILIHSFAAGVATVSFINRESGMAMTAEGNGSGTGTVKQRAPTGKDSEKWEITLV